MNIFIFILLFGAQIISIKEVAVESKFIKNFTISQYLFSFSSNFWTFSSYLKIWRDVENPIRYFLQVIVQKTGNVLE